MTQDIDVAWLVTNAERVQNKIHELEAQNEDL